MRRRNMLKDIAALVAELTLEEKAALCSGISSWETTPIKRKDIRNNVKDKLQELYQNGQIDKETYAEILTMCDLTFTKIDEGMENSDKNGYLSADEMASFYKNLDRYSFDENKQRIIGGSGEDAVMIDGGDDMLQVGGEY